MTSVSATKPIYATWKFRKDITARQRANLSGPFEELPPPPPVTTYRGPAVCLVLRADRHPLADFRDDRLGRMMCRLIGTRMEAMNDALATLLGGSPRTWRESVYHDCLWVEHPIGSEKWHCWHGLNHKGSHGDT